MENMYMYHGHVPYETKVKSKTGYKEKSPFPSFLTTIVYRDFSEPWTIKNWMFNFVSLLKYTEADG